MAEGAPFFPTIQDVLTRRGWQSTEALARETPGLELTDPGFWIEASAAIEEDVHPFLRTSDDLPLKM